MMNAYITDNAAHTAYLIVTAHDHRITMTAYHTDPRLIELHAGEPYQGGIHKADYRSYHELETALKYMGYTLGTIPADSPHITPATDPYAAANQRSNRYW